MLATQQTLSAQMLAQLRLLDPSISAEVGTPERKILDTVAEALSDVQVDLTQLNGALDIDAKSGTSLDNFLALFGFGRQQATKSNGFVTFQRISPAFTDIVIPAGTQVQSNTSDGMHGPPIYETVYQVTLKAGQLTVVAPVQSIYAGSSTNAGVNQLTQFAGTPVYGIDSMTNEAAVVGGTDAENDDELKIRFKNTIFRNLAGTQDQYMALAASAAYVSKANIVGPISRYREYIQVPPVDDSSSYNVNPSGVILEGGNGSAGQYTTALSSIPYSKHTYTTVPTFVSSGTGVSDTFYRDGVDWQLNTLPADKNRGDAYRFFHADSVIGSDPLLATNQPNITLLNVYTGTLDGYTSIRPGDIILFEHAYMSTASRNDFEHNISNCVDVFVNGSNDTTASCVIPTPGPSISMAFVSTPSTSKFYNGNYRRAGQPDVLPTVGNLFIPLFWEPVVGLPTSITIFDEEQSYIYFLNEHYWLVEDITELHGTVRARNGIEWNMNAVTGRGATSATDDTRTGFLLSQFDTGTPMEIANYVYDKNIVDLQAAMEASKQVTTDVLVHRARTRYFSFDITVMYVAGVNPTDVNASIATSVTTYLASAAFGSVIQLSDVLATIHNTAGVDNVRWSSDVPGYTDLDRVAETDYYGNPRVGLTYSSDIFLKDDELPALPAFSAGVQDNRNYALLPGLTIRARAQNTWIRA
jgi:uncharacterized phage protein gp47/JayE